jgi:hypothetical protein
MCPSSWETLPGSYLSQRLRFARLSTSASLRTTPVRTVFRPNQQFRPTWASLYQAPTARALFARPFSTMKRSNQAVPR